MNYLSGTVHEKVMEKGSRQGHVIGDAAPKEPDHKGHLKQIMHSETIL